MEKNILKIFLVVIIIVSTLISLYLKISPIKKGFDEVNLESYHILLGMLLSQ